MNKEKLTETVKKLLALAASSNKYEASLAIQRAQDLMLRHNIKLKDDITEKVIEIEFFINTPCNGLKGYYPFILETTCNLFGCYSIVKEQPPNISYTVLGYKANLEIAQYAIDSILNQARADYEKGYRHSRSIAFSQGFWRGFAQELETRFKRTKKPNKEGIVLWNSIKTERDSRVTGHLHFRLAGITGESFGRVSGRNVQIREGVTQARGFQIKDGDTFNFEKGKILVDKKVFEK